MVETAKRLGINGRIINGFITRNKQLQAPYEIINIFLKSSSDEDEGNVI